MFRSCIRPVFSAQEKRRFANDPHTAAPFRPKFLPTNIAQSRSTADDYIPGLHAPTPDESVGDTGIILGESLGNHAVSGVEHDQRLLGRITQGAGHDDFAAFVCVLHHFQMRTAEGTRRSAKFSTTS